MARICVCVWGGGGEGGGEWLTCMEGGKVACRLGDKREQVFESLRHDEQAAAAVGKREVLVN